MKFIKKLKHKLKLLWLKRKWVIQSIYNTKEFREANNFLQLEKDLIDQYHEAKRGEDKIGIAKAKGRLEVIEFIKKII
jgi:hypothetical protein